MTEYVAIYLIDSPNQRVLYLNKNHGPKRLIGKLNGFGGEITDADRKWEDYIIRGARRELCEELGEITGLEFFFTNPIKHRGKLFVEEDLVHILTMEMPNEVKEGPLENEGTMLYKPLDYHRTNPFEFPNGDSNMLEHLFYTQEFFEVNSKLFK